MPSALRCFCAKGERLKLAPPCFSCLLLHKTAYFWLYNLAYRYFQQIPVKETLSAVGGGDRPVSCLLSLWTEAIHALQFCVSFWILFIIVFIENTRRANRTKNRHMVWADNDPVSIFHYFYELVSTFSCWWVRRESGKTAYLGNDTTVTL